MQTQNRNYLSSITILVVDSQADSPADIDEDHGSLVDGEISKEDTVVPIGADELHDHNEIGEHLLKCPIPV